MTTDDFTDDDAAFDEAMTGRELHELFFMDNPVLVKVIVGDEPETGVELEISTDPYDLDTL